MTITIFPVKILTLVLIVYLAFQYGYHRRDLAANKWVDDECKCIANIYDESCKIFCKDDFCKEN